MDHRIDLRTIAGCATVVAALLLSSPGVRAERAGNVSEAGPTCGSPRFVDPAPELDAFLANVRREQALRNSSQDEPSGYIVLNNAGYNYQPARNAAAASREAKSHEKR